MRLEEIEMDSLFLERLRGEIIPSAQWVQYMRRRERYVMKVLQKFVLTDVSPLPMMIGTECAVLIFHALHLFLPDGLPQLDAVTIETMEDIKTDEAVDLQISVFRAENNGFLRMVWAHAELRASELAWSSDEREVTIYYVMSIAVYFYTLYREQIRRDQTKNRLSFGR